MTTARKTRVNRGGRPVKHGRPQALASTPKMPLSLPPAAPEQPVTVPAQSPLTGSMALHEDSTIRTTALKIIAMRSAGLGEDEIAKALGLSRSTLAGYVYKAGRNGFLDLDDPKDRLEYQVLHKVVKRLDEALDETNERVLQTGMKENTAVALKVADGTLFKKFGQDIGQQGVQTAIAIRIEMPAGPVPTVREGTTGGAMAFIDAEIERVP